MKTRENIDILLKYVSLDALKQMNPDGHTIFVCEFYS